MLLAALQVTGFTANSPQATLQTLVKGSDEDVALQIMEDELEGIVMYGLM